MNILESVDEYVKYVKNNSYVYAMQKQGIDIFLNYIKSSSVSEEISDVNAIDINKLLAYWIPKNKKYLSEVQAYQIVYTVHDIFQYLLKNSHVNENHYPALLDIYGEEYMRVYRIRNMLLKVTKDPILAVNPFVIDLNNYRNKKNKTDYTEMATAYEQAVFKVEECKEGGQVILTKLYQNKEYKLLLEFPTYKYFKKGDLIHAVIKRKLFYVYWELAEVKSYYLPEALAYLQ